VPFAVRRALFAACLAAASALAASAPAAAPPVAWCGTPSAVDRFPDEVSGFAWHVVYAIPSDGTDRFAAIASGIATDLSAIDAWWNAQDPSRRIRFDLFAFPGCSPGPGQLDLSSVRLPKPASAYQPAAGRLDLLVGDLNAAPFGFSSPDKKYLVYYDGPVEDPNACGEGNAGIVDGGAKAFAVVYLQACGQQTPGDGEGSAAVTAAHEMTHVFDAVDSQAPHQCEGGHVCDSPSELMNATGSGGDVLSALVLDAGRDDYYGHSGPWWDVQDSPFLIRIGGPDQAPPAGPARVVATSVGTLVRLSWPAATDDVGVAGYRVYRDGALLTQASQPQVSDRAPLGTTFVYGVRAYDAAGGLGPLSEVRFRVGVGVVDESGALVEDTVAPPGVKGLRATLGARALRLRWAGARDAGGLRGYIVERNRRRIALVKRRSIAVPLARANATWSVRAVDRAGNVGPRLESLKVP
jgi:hypothetical protein